MSDPSHDSHGSTPAAWTLVIIVMIGFLVGCIAMVAAWEIGIWVGVGIVVVGCIVGKVMQMMASSPAGEGAEHRDAANAG